MATITDSSLSPQSITYSNELIPFHPEATEDLPTTITNLTKEHADIRWQKISCIAAYLFLAFGTIGALGYLCSESPVYSVLPITAGLGFLSTVDKFQFYCINPLNTRLKEIEESKKTTIQIEEELRFLEQLTEPQLRKHFLKFKLFSKQEAREASLDDLKSRLVLVAKFHYYRKKAREYTKLANEAKLEGKTFSDQAEREEDPNQKKILISKSRERFLTGYSYEEELAIPYKLFASFMKSLVKTPRSRKGFEDYGSFEFSTFTDRHIQSNYQKEITYFKNKERKYSREELISFSINKISKDIFFL